MSPDRRVTAVCATGLEAWAVRRRARGVRVVRVGVGGRLAGGISPIVVSAGLCGGLVAGQTPGTVVIATHVADERGAIVACDPALSAALERAARSLGFPVATGSLVSTRAMVTGAGRTNWARQGHIAVDMESAGSATAAPRFGVVRVILDAPDRELSPEWASGGRALLHPRNWRDALWLAVSAPRFSLRAGTVLQAALLGDIDAEV